MAGLTKVLAVYLAGCSFSAPSPHLDIIPKSTNTYCVNYTCYFTISASNISGASRLTITCNFGDGTSTETWASVSSNGTASALVPHTYTRAGNYTMYATAVAGGLLFHASPRSITITTAPSCNLMDMQTLTYGSRRIAKVTESR